MNEPLHPSPEHTAPDSTIERTGGGECGRHLSGPAAADLERLRSVIGRYARVLVAYSGGADSTLVAAVAHDLLGAEAQAVIGLSPSVAASDRARAIDVARRIGVRCLEVDTHEIDDPAYRANSGDRCYHCKSELYRRLDAVREAEDCAVVFDGTNTDDFGDTRPGLTAAREQRVVSPLAEAGLDKAAVRRLSRELELPTWDLPENACLASRLPQGTPVSAARLKRVELAEHALHDLGFRQVRVRDEGERGRVEVAATELAAALGPEMQARIEEAVRGAGFAAAFVDPGGYRRGGADNHG